MAKLKYELTDAAKRDIVQVLLESRRQFVEAARTRYRKILEQAIEDICLDPNRIGARIRDELGPSVQTYHIAYRKQRASHQNRIVEKPRHLLVYKQIKTASLLIIRVLHDAMELSHHNPPRFRFRIRRRLTRDPNAGSAGRGDSAHNGTLRRIHPFWKVYGLC